MGGFCLGGFATITFCAFSLHSRLVSGHMFERRVESFDLSQHMHKTILYNKDKFVQMKNNVYILLLTSVLGTVMAVTGFSLFHYNF